MESAFNSNIPIIRFKHLCREYAIATYYTIGLALTISQNQEIPSYMFKKGTQSNKVTEY